MANIRLRKTIRVDIQTMAYLSNLEKRIHRLTIRLTDLEYKLLQEEAKETDKSVSEIIRARLWPN